MDKKTRNKLIIFIIFALIAVGIIGYTYIENKRKTDSLKQQYDIEIKAKEDEKQAEEKRIENERKERESFEGVKCDEAESLLFSEDKDKYNKVIKITSDVIEKYPDSKRAYTLRGRAYGFSSNIVAVNKDKALADLDKALEIDPEYGYGRFNKALIYELFGRYDEALVWYDKAIEVEPDYEWSYYGKASIYGRRGEIENTLVNLKKAIELKPSAKEAAKEEHDFDNVRHHKEFQDLINK